MLMPVMDIGRMRVFMFKWFVLMHMRVLSDKSVLVNMIMVKIIVPVHMVMLHMLMRMDMLMLFSDNKNCADYHDRKGNKKLHSRYFSKKSDRNYRANKRS